jgi:hypothetical protein
MSRSWNTSMLFAVLMICGTASAFAQPQGPDTLWTRTFGGPDNDYGFAVQSLPDGSVIAGGSGALTPPWNEHTAILTRLDRSGNVAWCNEFRQTSLREVDAFQVTSDGGLFIGGRTTNQDFEVLKMDSSRSVQWESVSPFYAALFLSVCVLEPREGGYLAVQSGMSGNGPDICVLRYDASGDTLWTHRYGGVGMDRITACFQTEDGGYILGGSIDVRDSLGNVHLDAYMLKLNSNGNEQWSRAYTAPDDEWINGLAVTDSGYLMVGYVQDLSTIQDYVYVQKVSLTGDSLWARRYSELGQAHCADVCRLPDGNLILCCSRNSTTMLLAMNQDGQILWTRDYAPGSHRYGVSMALSDETELTLAGWAVTSDSGYQMSVMRTETPQAVPHQPASIADDFILMQNYPNPFNGSTTITYYARTPGTYALSIYDVSGRFLRILDKGYHQSGMVTACFNPFGLASGSYYYKLEGAMGSKAARMTLLK